MAPVSNEQFLFSCIDNSTGGKVDWEKVAQECGIVTKAAAAIKYKRMKEKFGTVGDGKAGSDAGGDNDGEIATPKKKKTPAKKAVAEGSAKKGFAKKRKLEEATEDGDDNEEAAPVKNEEGDDDA